MKMAKPSERDIDAAGDLLSLLHQIDRGDYPNLDEDAEVPDWFDEDNFDHLRAFYDAVKATLDKGPGYPGRVIGGMCYVIMYDKNEIVDPASDAIDLHPKLVAALQAAEAAAQATVAQGEQADEVPPIGKLLDEFSELPVLWGLNEPGALVRHGDVFKMLVSAGKTYLAHKRAGDTGEQADGGANG